MVVLFYGEKDTSDHMHQTFARNSPTTDFRAIFLYNDDVSLLERLMNDIISQNKVHESIRNDVTNVLVCFRRQNIQNGNTEHSKKNSEPSKHSTLIQR